MSEYKKKFVLDEERIPKAGTTYSPISPNPPPPLIPPTQKPAGPRPDADLRRDHRQEVSPERWIEIPEEVLRSTPCGGPSPLIRAIRLEKALDTPAHIFYKYEGASPAGKPQAEHRGAAGVLQQDGRHQAAGYRNRRRPVGQRSALACKLFGLECMVYMVKVSYHQKPYRRMLMHTWGAKVHREPERSRRMSAATILDKDPECPGSLGIAISEAIEDT